MTEIIDINGFWFRVWTKADPREDPEWVHEGGPLHGEAWPGIKLRVYTLEEAIAQSEQLWNALENKQRLSGWSITDKYGKEKHPGTRTDRKFEDRIFDPDEINKYVASARRLYDLEHVAVVIAYEVDKDRFIMIEDDEIEDIAIESTHTIEIDRFVPRSQIDERYLDPPITLRQTTRSARTPLASSGKRCAAKITTLTKSRFG